MTTRKNKATVSTQILCDDVVPPHNFNYQLENYVIPPERRGDDILFNVVMLEDQIIRVGVSSLGSTQKPLLKVEVSSPDLLSDEEIKQLKHGINQWLGSFDDLKPFYDLVSNDPIMRAAIDMRYGAKDKANFTPFEAIIGTVCAQNIQFKRLYGMMGKLCDRLGDKVYVDGETYSAFPTIHTCATCSLEELQACKVGYRADYIRNITRALKNGQINLTELERMPYAQAKQSLMKLKGIGPYTADLCLILAFRRKDIFYLDRYVREVLWQFYFKGQQVSDDVLREFASERWPSYETWAIAMLTTDTEKLATRMSVPFRLKSGAKQ